MAYLIIILLSLLAVSGFVVSFRTYVKQRRRHQHSLSGKRRKAAQIPAYELYTWIDDEVSKGKLYRKTDMSDAELADELGLSKRQLQTVIANAYDKTVAEYLNERRIQAACRLLREQPDMTSEEISREAGFPSLNTFQRMFKNAMGQSPDRYRNQMKQSTL